MNINNKFIDSVRHFDYIFIFFLFLPPNLCSLIKANTIEREFHVLKTFRSLALRFRYDENLFSAQFFVSQNNRFNFREQIYCICGGIVEFVIFRMINGTLEHKSNINRYESQSNSISSEAF